MASPYATRDDVYLLGLSAQAFIALARPFDAVDLNTATVSLKAHGFSVDDLITFEVSDGGELPTDIAVATLYYPIPVSFDLFRVATSFGGTPVSGWVSEGSGWGIVLDPGRRLDKHLLDAAARIDEHLTAHDPPIQRDPNTGLYPTVLVGLNARMAARAAAISLQFENAEFRVATERLFALEERDEKMLADWKAGKPLQPRPTDLNTIADNSARAASGRDPIPWNPGVI
jgi:hypothetical protein